MTVQTSQTLSEITVSVDGDLDLSSVTVFQSAVEKAIVTKEDKKLVVDLRDTEYIDSAGLEQLLMANRKLMRRDERLKVLVNAGSRPQTVLSITGFNAVMDVESLNSEL